jgi:hypothetical protein
MMSQSSRNSFFVLVIRVHIRNTKTTRAMARRMDTGMMYWLETFELGSTAAAMLLWVRGALVLSVGTYPVAKRVSRASQQGPEGRQRKERSDDWSEKIPQ